MKDTATELTLGASVSGGGAAAWDGSAVWRQEFFKVEHDGEFGYFMALLNPTSATTATFTAELTAKTASSGTVRLQVRISIDWQK